MVRVKLHSGPPLLSSVDDGRGFSREDAVVMRERVARKVASMSVMFSGLDNASLSEDDDSNGTS